MKETNAKTRGKSTLMNGIYNERYVEETPLVYKLDLNHDMALDTSAHVDHPT